MTLSDAALLLSTARLVLEPVVESHAAELHALFGDPVLHRFTPYEPLSLEEQRDKCEKWSRRRSPAGDELWLNWAARHRAEGIVLGHFQAGVREDLSASIGYLVAGARQRQGYATEGLRAVITFLRRELGVRRVQAWIDTRNAASITTVEKIGMKPVERIANADFFKGSASDEWVYALSTEGSPGDQTS